VGRTITGAEPATGTSSTPHRERPRRSIRFVDVVLGFVAVVLTFVWAAGTVPSGTDSGGISSVDAFWV